MSEQIKDLEQQIKKLREGKILYGTHLSILMENYYQNRTSENISKMDELRKEVSAIDIKLNPLLEAYEKLHHKYYVIFSSEMPDTLGRTKSRYTFQSTMLSTINCNIDTSTDGFDIVKFPNLMELVTEFGQKLIHSYTNVCFNRIAQIK
jgi:hypothetical protein